MWKLFLGPATLATTIRLSTPITLSAMGGLYGEQANIFNISLESVMLTSAFFATFGSYTHESAWMGLLYGIIAGIIMSMVFGFFVLYLKADPIVIGVALNLGSWGFTSLLLLNIFGARGSFLHPRIKSFKTINLALLDDLPIIGSILNNHSILVYIGILAVFISYIVIYKTSFGLRLRGVGINEKAAQVSGTNTLSYKWITLVITGALVGVAGAFLPLSGISMFTENMSAGRGFLATAAIYIGKGNPFKIWFAAVVFAYANAVAVGLQGYNIPSQIILMAPYLATILVLILTNLKNLKKGLQI